MRIAIIGGGLFGSTVAIHAARAGHDVHLLEAKPGLMMGATAGTYSRIHRGAHYPRHPATGRESRRAEVSFRKEYGAAVIDGGRQAYVVPDDPRNHVTVDRFRHFLDDEGIAFVEHDGVFMVEEPRVDLSVLQALVRQKVHDAGVSVHCNMVAMASLRRDFDQIVVAAYSGLNNVLDVLGCEPSEYKFQVVERPVALLPESFRRTSIVIVDGPFGCVDPLDDTPLHVLGHVVHTVHAENTGFYPVIPAELAPLLDAGIIRNQYCSRFQNVIDDLANFLPSLHDAVYCGSSFVLRAVLANVEDSDKRPTIVQRCDDQVISVFSGKLGTACRAASEVLSLIASTEAMAA